MECISWTIKYLLLLMHGVTMKQNFVLKCRKYVVRLPGRLPVLTSDCGFIQYFQMNTVKIGADSLFLVLCIIVIFICLYKFMPYNFRSCKVIIKITSISKPKIKYSKLHIFIVLISAN